MLQSYAYLLAAVWAFATTTLAVKPVDVLGKDFVNSETKERFQIIGVDYQPGGASGFDGKSDPLSNSTACLRDAAILQKLGINTIRIYNLAPNANHDKCASIFNAAGIHMVLDVNSPLYGGYIDRTDPASTYNAQYFHQVYGIIEAFKNYPNTLAFFAGNEIINEQSVKEIPAYIRAVQRDMKDYIARHASRHIPVGYSAADVRPILMDTAHYMSCELKNSTSSRSDFFGLNSYSWCGHSSYTISGYDILTSDLSSVSLPVFFSEYGCNLVRPRTFDEVGALYGEDMSRAFSGGLVYEYSQEQNQYGLVKINDNGTVTLLIDYDYLREQYEKLDINRIQSVNSLQTSIEPQECSHSLLNTTAFLNSFDLPTRPSKVQDMIDHGLSKANTGKLVPVKSTTIPETVYNHQGEVLKGIQFRALECNRSNTPGPGPICPNGKMDSSSLSGGAGHNRDSKKQSAASKTSTLLPFGVLAGTLVFVMTML